MSTHKEHPANEELLGLLRELDGGIDTPFGQRLASKEAVLPLEWPPAARRRERSAAMLEKHLVQVHREELGALLKDACLRLLVTDEKLGGMVFLNKINGLSQEPKKPVEWSQELKIRRDTFPDPPGSEAEMLVLERLVAPIVGKAPSLREVAEAGLRLAPSTAFEIYRGRGLEAEGNLREAGEVLERAYANSSLHMNRLVAACARGSIAFLSNEFPTALAWCKLSCSGREPYLSGALSWLFFAVPSGQAEDFLQAAHEFHNHSDGNQSLMTSFCVRKRAERLDGVWKPSKAALSLLEKTSSDDHVQQVLNIFR